jgi:hypothetical protein
MSGTANTKFTFSNTFPELEVTPTTAVGPYILPPRFGRDTSSSNLEMHFQGFCVPSTTSSTKGIQPGDNPDQKAFGLSFHQVGSKPNPSIQIAQVTVLKEYVFSSDASTRKTLLSSFRLFAQQIEALEVPVSDENGGLSLGTTETLLNNIAVNLPLTLPETLQFVYNFDANSQSIDLEPGLLLTIATAGYQYCGPPGSPGYGLNSFSGSGVQILTLGRQANGTLSFNGFLSRLSPGVTLSPNTPPDDNHKCLVFAASPIDFQLSSNARRHWRVVTSATMPSSMNIDNSGASSVNCAMLLGADTFADLDAATEAALAGDQYCGVQRSGNNPIVAVTFTSRVIVIPQIQVSVNGNPIVIPIGTTMRDIVFQHLLVPSSQIVTYGSNVDSSSLSCSMQRWVANTAEPFSVTSPGPTVQVDYLDFSPANTSDPILSGPEGDVFDIPILKGDRVYVGPKDGYQGDRIG